MKCRICGEKASVNMREHKLSLCKEHYLEWVPAQAERSIKKYGLFTHDEKILVAVSGGKDSLSLWDILQRLDYHVEGLYICLGIDEGIRYSTESQRLAEKFASDHNLKLNVVDIQQEYGATLPQITRGTHRGRSKPCSVCGLVKRHVMNRFARDLGFDVLATGHNLDD
jgi:tRNA(Ile)-lysidine synthase TilS/MesJ